MKGENNNPNMEPNMEKTHRQHKDIKARLKELNETQMQKLRAALVMALASILLISGATYAWFTVGNSVRVKSLSLQVAAEGKLYIGETENDAKTKKSILLDLNMDNNAKILYPATTTDGKTFLKPVYASDSEVSGSTALTDKDSIEDYRFEKEIWLYIEEKVAPSNINRTYDITLAKRGEGTEPEKLGSYVDAVAGTTSHPEYSIRISLETDEGVVVYEPNYDQKVGGTVGTDLADNKAAVFDNTFTPEANIHRQSLSGGFAQETGNTYYTNDSSALFTMKPNEAKKVTVRVWFEGTDPECVNAIEAQKIIGQLKFVSHNQADAKKD